MNEPDERDVGMFSRCDRPNLLDIDRARDHFMAEPGDDLGEQCKPVASLVGDQDAEVLNSVLGHRPIVGTWDQGHLRTVPSYGTLGPRVFQRAVVVDNAVRGSQQSTRNDPPSAAWVGALLDLKVSRSAMRLI